MIDIEVSSRHIGSYGLNDNGKTRVERNVVLGGLQTVTWLTGGELYTLTVRSDVWSEHRRHDM